jgi:hypothetical protein
VQWQWLHVCHHLNWPSKCVQLCPSGWKNESKEQPTLDLCSFCFGLYDKYGAFLFVSCWCPPIWDCLTLDNYQTCQVYMCYTLQISVKSRCLWASFHPLTPLLVISAKEGNLIKSQYEMLKLSTKRWISAFNVQGLRGIIEAVQVGAVKIYVAAVEALRKIERRGETQEIDGFLGPPPPPFEC